MVSADGIVVKLSGIGKASQIVSILGISPLMKASGANLELKREA